MTNADTAPISVEVRSTLVILRDQEGHVAFPNSYFLSFKMGEKKKKYIYIYVYIYTPDSRKHGEDSTKKLAKYYFLFS